MRCWETESATRFRAVVLEGSSVRTSRVSSGMSSVGTRGGAAARGEGVGGGMAVGSRTGVLVWEIVDWSRARFARRKVKKAGVVLVVCLGKLVVAGACVSGVADLEDGIAEGKALGARGIAGEMGHPSPYHGFRGAGNKNMPGFLVVFDPWRVRVVDPSH